MKTQMEELSKGGSRNFQLLSTKSRKANQKMKMHQMKKENKKKKASRSLAARKRNRLLQRNCHGEQIVDRE